MRASKRIHAVESRPSASRKRQIAAEQLLLAALCQQTISPPLREEVHRRLSTRKLAHSDHQLVFWALSRLPAAAPQLIREALATRLTLMGFPDFDIDPLFACPPPSDQEISALLKAL